MEDLVQTTRRDLANVIEGGLDIISFVTRATDVLRRAIQFQRCCWHSVDPGTVLFTGSVNQNVACSGRWLAEHEYVIDDVNKWSFLARSGRLAGATSLATHGDLSRSVRHRSHEAYGIGDELRGSFIAGGSYWGAAGFLRDADQPNFSEADVRLLASLSATIAEGFRRALLTTSVERATNELTAPGVVTFDEHGDLESISAGAEQWIEQMIEVPPPAHPSESKIVQAVAVRARSLPLGEDPLEAVARTRVQTRSGRWLVLYGTRLSGAVAGRTAVIIQPARAHEVAPLVALAYGLSERECQVTALCIKGLATKEIAQLLGVSPYTVQDHLKSIFQKTGVRSRGELVAHIFLEHYIPRWERLTARADGWIARGEQS